MSTFKNAGFVLSDLLLAATTVACNSGPNEFDNEEEPHCPVFLLLEDSRSGKMGTVNCTLAEAP